MVNSLTKYKEAFCARVRGARDAAGYKQEEMAAKLRIRRDRYAKYERRSLMPPQFIAEFAQITGHDTWFILTGQPRQDAKPDYDGKDRRGWGGVPGLYYGEERRRLSRDN